MNDMSIALVCTIVGGICTILGTIIGYKTFKETSEKDSEDKIKKMKEEVKEDTRYNARIESKLDYIGGDIKEVRDDVKAMGVRQEDMAERLVKVEESTKSAHHRIDGLEKENKIKKG